MIFNRMETNNYQLVSVEESEDAKTSGFNFRRFIHRCLKNWYWILISVLLCGTVAAYYILTTRPVYTRTASVLIKEAATRRMATSDIESVLSFSGGSSMSSKVVNEVIAFQSPALMQEAVKRLGLNTEYFSRGMFRDDVIYGAQVPVEVEILNVPSKLSLSFNIAKDGDGKVSVSKFKCQMDKDKMDIAPFVAAFGDTVHTGLCDVVIRQRDWFQGKWEKDVIVKYAPVEAVSGRYTAAFKAAPADEKNKSDVLTLAINDNSVQRGDDILNMIINIYNENWVEDKNKMAVSTSNFIDARLASLEMELKDVDDDISEFQSQNLMPDMKTVSELYVTQLREASLRRQELSSQLTVFNSIKQYLQENPGVDNLIPLSASISNNPISAEIAEYNKNVLVKNNIRANSGATSPPVVDMTLSLESTRTALEHTIEAQIAIISQNVEDLRRYERSNDTRMAESPSKAKYLLSVGRQQKVKEQLYLYLLQKREENELSQAFTAYNTRIITPPMGSGAPTSPKKMRIVFIALFLGIFVPLFVIYILELTDNKIREKRDLEVLSLPSLGEIPFEAFKKKGLKKLVVRKKVQEIPEVVVKPGARSVINEAFRVFRTNLEFMERGIKCPVISLTSFNPGSGKTFISMNCAAALSIKGKKVLVIDCDLRRSSLSEYVGLPKLGITDYLSGSVTDVESCIVPVEGFKSLWVLPVGTVPPNPSELLSQGIFAEMIEKFKQQYDTIVIDCPPVDLVADTQIINECVDRTIFVVRAGVLERKDVVNLQKAYDNKRLKNLCYVFNGVERASSYYGHYGAYGHYGK